MMSFNSCKLILLFQHLLVFCNSDYFMTKRGPNQPVLTEASLMPAGHISLGKALMTSSWLKRQWAAAGGMRLLLNGRQFALLDTISKGQMEKMTFPNLLGIFQRFHNKTLVYPFSKNQTGMDGQTRKFNRKSILSLRVEILQ